MDCESAHIYTLKEVISVTQNSVWKKAQGLELHVSQNIMSEFSVGFDKRIPEDTKKELLSLIKKDPKVFLD